MRHRDGSYCWLQWNARPARSLIYAVARDMTEQKRAADRLRQAEEQLRQAQKLETVGQLTAGVAHDFNNLLTSILGSLELIETRINDESGARLLRGAIRSAQRGARLNEQLLAFARKQPLIPRIVDLNAVVTGMDALLRSSIGDSIRVETVLGDDLWPALADQTQLELVILNLAINARDAMPLGGSLTIETRNVTRGPPESAEEPPAGDYVAVSVSDTGTGMSDEVRRRAIEPFFTTKGPGKGSGLGLSMVFGVARQSGGGVSLDSRLGEGTTATVYLPRAGERARLDGGAAPEAGEPADLVGDEVVLVVDDDGDVREVTKALLHSMGCRVLDAGSGAAAIDLLAQDVRIDAMLVDIAMPGMDGVETSRRARAVRPDLPILFATGYADVARFADQIAPSGIVRKPFRRGEARRAAASRARPGRLAGRCAPVFRPRRLTLPEARPRAGRYTTGDSASGTRVSASAAIRRQRRRCVRSGAAPSASRTALGAAPPSIAKASAATAATPCWRTCATNSPRLHAGGSASHAWLPAGCADSSKSPRSLARDLLPRGVLGPDGADDVEGGAVLDPPGGERGEERRGHERRGAERAREPHRLGRLRRAQIGDAQPRGEAFRQRRDMKDELRRERGEGRGGLRGKEPVRVVLDDEEPVPARDRRDRLRARCRHRRRRRVVDRGRAVERLRPGAPADRLHRLGNEPLAVERHRREAQAQMRCERPEPRIGERLGEDEVAGLERRRRAR